MSKIEGIRLKINKFFRLTFAEKRKKKLKNQNFTIISINCWGGMIYESYNLRKNSPTVGLFIMPKDYIKFIKNLKKYLKIKLTFIKPEDSKYTDVLKNDSRFGSYPIGKLGDIEIMFLHYKNEKEAYEKWERRKQRINFDNIIYKFNDQNGCTKSDFYEFVNLPLPNKLFFTVKDWDRPLNSDSKNICVMKINQLFNKDFVFASREPFGNKITEYINNIMIK